jgi:multicomponent K+:H+ antiporter subunit D
MMTWLDFWQQHTPIFSILIPAFTGFILLLLGNPGAGQLAQDHRQTWRRGLSIVATALGFITAISYFVHAVQGKSVSINSANGQHLLVLSSCSTDFQHLCCS